jgi:hypothetical protein
VTDAGLVHLKGMTRLQSLRLIDTQITGDRLSMTDVWLSKVVAVSAIRNGKVFFDQKNPDKLSLHDL